MIFFFDRYTEHVKNCRIPCGAWDGRRKSWLWKKNGFLPDGISSPYGYFRTRYHREIQAEKDLSAAFLNVPEPWEICINGQQRDHLL